MKTLSSLMLSLCAIAVVGCAVGPDYETPETQAPNDWISGEAYDYSEKGEIDQEWWTNFNDPVLAKLIAKASADNFDLKIAEARIQQARANVSSAFAALLPSGQMTTTAEREANQVPLPSNFPGASFITKPFNLFQAGFDATWEADLFGGRHRAEEAAEAQLAASEASRDDVRVSLLAEVARTYVLAREAELRLAAAEKAVAANQRILEIAREQFEAGQSPRLNVTQAEAKLEEVQTQMPYFRDLRARSTFGLDVLLGEQPGYAQRMIAASEAIPEVNKKLVLAAPASVIAQRPDIRVAERTLAAATSQQGEALARFFPDISLSGFFGVMNSNTGKLFTGSSESWFASGNMMWPILSYNSLAANLDAANAKQQEAMAAYQKTIVSALSDVERSLTSYIEQQKFLKSAANDFEKTAHAREIADQRYQKGLTSRVEALQADLQVYASQDRLIQARAQASMNLIAVYKSLGGGWKVPAVK